MKKVLSVVLAVAMVLACVASLAFVVGTQQGTAAPTNSALKVEDFHVTDELAMTTGVKVYSALADLENQAYAKNQIIRFALDLAVYNPNYLASGVEHTSSGYGNAAQLIIESDTVDFALNRQQPYTCMVLYKPYYVDGIVSTNLVNAVANNAGYTPEVSEDHGTMKLDVHYLTRADGTDAGNELFDMAYVSSHSRFDKTNGMYLYGVSKDTWTEKTDYTLVFTGVTKGELNQEGLVTVSMKDKAGDTFDDATQGVVTVEKNGRTYRIYKLYHNVGWTNQANADMYNGVGLLWADDKTTTYPTVYDVDVVGYRVDVLLGNADGKVETEGDNVWGVVGRFETEQVRWGSLAPVDLQGTDVEGVGRSLGLDYYGGGTGATNAGWHKVTEALTYNRYYIDNGTEVYRTGTGADYLYAPSETQQLVGYGVTARQALENLMTDFGFGTGTQYTYKIQDANFTNAATYEQLGEATYNGNAIVIEQPEENPDVDEGTGDEEVPDEGDIDEELPDEGDIDEEPIPDEPVPETGDASAAVAVALTAAALVAAAGLAVVLKKAR